MFNLFLLLGLIWYVKSKFFDAKHICFVVVEQHLVPKLAKRVDLSTETIVQDILVLFSQRLRLKFSSQLRVIPGLSLSEPMLYKKLVNISFLLPIHLLCKFFLLLLKLFLLLLLKHLLLLLFLQQ